MCSHGSALTGMRYICKREHVHSPIQRGAENDDEAAVACHGDADATQCAAPLHSKVAELRT